MREEFLEITDDAERLAFYGQHYETIKRGQADAESSYNYLKLEKEILEYLVKGESPAYPILINNLAPLLRDLASYEPENASGYLKQAKMYFEEAAKIAKDSGDEKKYAIRINNLALLISDLASYEPENASGYLKQAKMYFEEAAKIAKDSGDEKSYAITINNLAALLRDLASYEPENASGYLKQAKMYFEEAAKIAKDSGDDKNYATDINNLAGLLRDLASYEPENASGYLKQAKMYYEEAAKIAKDSGDEKSYAITINNLAALLRDLASYEPENASGYLKQVKMYFEEAAKIAKDGGDEKSYAITINNLAALLRNLASYEPENASGYLKDAKEYFEEAAKIAKDGGDEKNYAITINNLAGLLSDLASYEPENASGYLKDAHDRLHNTSIPIVRKAEDWESLSRWSGNLSYILLNLYALDSRIEHLTSAQSFLEESFRHPVTRHDLRVINLRTLGNVHKRLAGAYLSGNEQRSLEHLKSASGCFQRLADLTGNEDYRIESLDLIIRSRSLLAKNTRERRKRRSLYSECSDTASTLSEIQPSRSDEWESLSEYFRGQMCVNEGVGTESLKNALAHFKAAKTNLDRANVCYYLYTVILQLKEFFSKDQDTPSKMGEEIKSAIASLKRVSSPKTKEYVGFLEGLKRSLEADGSSVDLDKVRDDVGEIISGMEHYALADFSRGIASDVQRQSARMDQVDFDVSLRKIGGWLYVTVSNRGEKPIVGTLSVESLDRRLKLDETIIELHGESIVTRKIPNRDFCIPCRLASGMPPDFIDFKIGLEIAGQKPITIPATLPLGNVIEIEGRGVTVESITLPEECLIYDDTIRMALVQLEIDLVHDGDGYKIGGDLEAYRERILDVFSKLPEDVEVVIFPELSIPFEFLSQLQRISQEQNLLIVAGSHYVTKTGGYLELGFARPVHEKDIWKSISPLITPSGRIYHSEKIFPAPTYEQKMTRGEYLNIYKFYNSDYNFTVLICIDFERDAPGLLMDKFTPDLINVISVNSGKSARERYYNRFSSLARSRGSIAFTYTNVSGFSLDGITKRIDGKPVESGYSNIFSEYYHDEKPKEKRVWGQHFTKDLEGDLIRIFQHNLKGGTSISTRTDYVPVFEEIDLIRLDWGLSPHPGNGIPRGG
jgi:hypothetical protein